MGGYAAPALSSPFIFRQILTRIVLPTGEVGEAVVLEPGAGLLHIDAPQQVQASITGPQH